MHTKFTGVTNKYYVCRMIKCLNYIKSHKASHLNIVLHPGFISTHIRKMFFRLCFTNLIADIIETADRLFILLHYRQFKRIIDNNLHRKKNYVESQMF